jgi:hypothetical protein
MNRPKWNHPKPSNANQGSTRKQGASEAAVALSLGSPVVSEEQACSSLAPDARCSSSGSEGMAAMQRLDLGSRLGGSEVDARSTTGHAHTLQDGHAAGAASDAAEQEDVCLAAVEEECAESAAGAGAARDGLSKRGSDTKAMKSKRPGNAMRSLASATLQTTREDVGDVAADAMLKKIVDWLGTPVFALLFACVALDAACAMSLDHAT